MFDLANTGHRPTGHHQLNNLCSTPDDTGDQFQV